MDLKYSNACKEVLVLFDYFLDENDLSKIPEKQNILVNGVFFLVKKVAFCTIKRAIVTLNRNVVKYT